MILQKSIPWSMVLVALFFLTSCAHLLQPSRSKEKAEVYLQKAADELNRKEYQLSLKSTMESIKLNSREPSAYNQLALIYMETKRYKKSEEAFQQALSLKFDYPEVFNNMGVLMNRQRKYTQAIELFNKALANESYGTPENARTNMGYAYYKLGKLKEARKHHLAALDVAPYFCLAYKNLGDTYAKGRNFARAAEFYKKSLTHCPLYQESHYKFGLALMKAGKRNQAKQQLEKLVARHREGPYVTRSSKVLKYLQ